MLKTRENNAQAVVEPLDKKHSSSKTLVSLRTRLQHTRKTLPKRSKTLTKLENTRKMLKTHIHFQVSASSIHPPPPPPLPISHFPPPANPNHLPSAPLATTAYSPATTARGAMGRLLLVVVPAPSLAPTCPAPPLSAASVLEVVMVEEITWSSSSLLLFRPDPLLH